MEPGNNNESYKKPTRANTEIFFTKYQGLKTHLLLYFFIALEWITGPMKNKESRFTTGIGLS